MATIKQFEDLEIWQNARMICKKVNDLTKKENFKKDFSLVDQIRRSSGSAMDNIAEGFERDGNKEFIYFLNISKGSIGETRSQLYRSLDFGYISEQEFEIHKAECLSLSKQIRSFSDYLKQSEYKGHKFK
jgi:four helix bundle protein